MQSYLHHLNIIDLLSEKHAQLRKAVRDEWARQGNAPVTDTETYILALLQRNPMTIAQLARVIDISRQGTHKCVQNLISRNYIQVENLEGNSKSKLLVLTSKGILFCNETLIIKQKFEENIKNAIGEDHLILLRQVLQKEWF